MPRYSLDPSPLSGGPLPPAQRDGSCDLYSPGHQIHYRHQGDAVRSPSRPVAGAILDGTRLTLVLDDDTELTWRHHDPVRLRRVLAEVRRSGVAVSDRQVTVDAVSVAAPISARGVVVAALSIVVRGDSPAAVRPMAPGVQAAARAISRSLSG